MRRPINWVVVLISICFLLANTTLTGRGIGDFYSASGDKTPDTGELFTLTMPDFGAMYVAQPAVVVTMDDAFPDSTGIYSSGTMSRLDYEPVAASARLRAAHTSGWNGVASADPFEFVEALEDERPVVTRVR